MSAAFSPTGRDFATRHCDILLTMYSDLGHARRQIEDLKRQARKAGRSIKVYTVVHVVCRSTDAEAREYHHHYAGEMADNEAVENFARAMAPSAPVVARILDANRMAIAGGAGSAAVVGAPATVARAFNEIRDAGFDGVAVAMVDYAAELDGLIEALDARL